MVPAVYTAGLGYVGPPGLKCATSKLTRPVTKECATSVATGRSYPAKNRRLVMKAGRAMPVWLLGSESVT